MPTPRLPDEVWEEIIDSCRSFLDGGDWALEESYQVLHACSLTCQAWSPRSRLRLYSVLLFRRHRDVGSYLETLAAYPFLADLPRTMVVNSAEEYIPFASEDLAQRLPNIRTLWLFVDWTLYPSTYYTMVRQYSVTQLYTHVQLTIQNVGNLYRLLYTLPNLRQLHMASTSHGRILKPASLCSSLSDADVLRTLRMIPPGRQSLVHCIVLTNLEIEASWLEILSIYTPAMFDVYVNQLSIRCLTTRSPRYESPLLGLHGLLSYISLFASLETLIFIVEPENLHHNALGDSADGTAFYPWITSALSQARTHAMLSVVRLRFWRPQSVWTSAPLSRYGFLEMLATRALEDALCDIPNLSQLTVELPAGPGDPPDAWRWWETELRKRFVRLDAQISAAVHPRSDTFSEEACRPIWMNFSEETLDAYRILSQRRYPPPAQVLKTEIVVAFDYVPLTQLLYGRGRGVSRPHEPAFPHDAAVGEEMDIVVEPSGLLMPPEEPLAQRHCVRSRGENGEPGSPITRAELAHLVSADLHALMEQHTLVHNGRAVEFAQLCLIEVQQIADDTLQALFGIIPAGRPLAAG